MILNKEELEIFLGKVAGKSLKAGIKESLLTDIIEAGVKFGNNREIKRSTKRKEKDKFCYCDSLIRW